MTSLLNRYSVSVGRYIVLYNKTKHRGSRVGHWSGGGFGDLLGIRSVSTRHPVIPIP